MRVQMRSAVATYATTSMSSDTESRRSRALRINETERLSDGPACDSVRSGADHRRTGCQLRVDKFINKVRNAAVDALNGHGHGLAWPICWRLFKCTFAIWNDSALLHHPGEGSRRKFWWHSHIHLQSSSTIHHLACVALEDNEIYARAAAKWQPLDSSCQSNESTAQRPTLLQLLRPGPEICARLSVCRYAM